MSGWGRFRSWVRAVLRRSRMEHDMDAELRFHVEARAEDLMRGGVPREEALRRARIEFGGIEQAKEECREARGVRFFDELAQDLRFALRMLRKSPGFAAVGIVTLALGIGVNAAIFGLVDSALLHILPFRQPERLVHIWTTDAGGDQHTPLPEQYLALRRDSQAFEQVAAFGWVENFYQSDGSGWQNLPGLAVSSNLLPVLGIQPFMGRNFFEAEQTLGQDSVVMLSHRCWRTRFHSDPQILGKQIALNRRPVTIVGVMPHSFSAYTENVDIFSPLVVESYLSNGAARVAGLARVRIVARLKQSVTLDQARADAEAVAETLRTASRPADRSGHLMLEDFGEVLRNPGPTLQNARNGLWMMAAAAGVVLLIACANVASLLLARGVKRHRELALRSALGCSRGRLIRQLLTENALLFLCGASLGLVAARWSEEIITKMAAGVVSNTAYVDVNARVLLVCLGATLLSALLFGLIPAMHTTRLNLNDNLKYAVQNATGESGARRPRNLLVIFQIALGMVLLVGFGLLFRSMLHVESAPFGFDPRNVLTATATLPTSRYAGLPARANLMQAVERSVRTVPGVDAAGMTDSLPMEGADSARISVKTSSSATSRIEEEIYFVSVSPDFFSTLSIAMLAGRSFREGDTRGAKPVAVVNHTFANTYFSGSNPIGYRLAFADSPANWREIVGVVSDFRQRNPEEDLRPLVYLPLAQTLPRRLSVAIRFRARGSGTAAHKISSALQSVDPELFWQMSSMQQEVHDSESLTLRRPVITLLASFGSLAVVLVVVGVFGVTSYSVAERTREIGIRIALGAAPKEVARLILWESVGVAVAGLSLGALGAIALARLFPTGSIGWSGSGIFLYGVSRTDALTYTVAAALLILVTLAASWVPARKVMRVDPIVALRYE